jgi:hypothetical protein
MLNEEINICYRYNKGYKTKERPRVRWIDKIKDFLIKYGYCAALATRFGLGV